MKRAGTRNVFFFLLGLNSVKKIEAEADTTQNDFYMCTIFWLAKPAFFRYNENFNLGRDFYAAYFVILRPEISKNN